MKMIKRFIYTLSFSALLVLAPANVLAAPSYVADANTDAVCSSIGSCSSGTNGNLTGIIKLVINAMSVIAGALAVIMIIVAGMRYITSGGDGSKVASAKNALIYAIIGLIIVALAQFIVKFVLKTSARA